MYGKDAMIHLNNITIQQWDWTDNIRLGTTLTTVITLIQLHNALQHAAAGFNNKRDYPVAHQLHSRASEKCNTI